MKNFTQNLFFVALLLFWNYNLCTRLMSDDDSMDLEELEEIVLIGGGVIDLAEDRVTPVASSTIKSEEIQKKLKSRYYERSFKHSFCLCFFPGKRLWRY